MEPQGSILLCQGLETSGLENSLAGEVQFSLPIPNTGVKHPQNVFSLHNMTSWYPLQDQPFVKDPPR